MTIYFGLNFYGERSCFHPKTSMFRYLNNGDELEGDELEVEWL